MHSITPSSGQLQLATVTRMTSGTYRSHTQRLMTGDIPLYTGVTLALGHPADKPLSVWEEMFLPGAHGERPQKRQHSGQHWRADPVRPVGDGDLHRGAFTRARRAAQLSPVVRCGRDSSRRHCWSRSSGARKADIESRSSAPLRSRRCGASSPDSAGIALVIAWLFTKHYFMGRNENLLHFDPLSIALVVLVPLVGLRTARRVAERSS